MNKENKKKPIFPQKALVSIYIPKEDIWINGEGTVDALKNTEGEYVFTTYLRKNYDKKCCEKCLNNKYALKDSEICGLPCDCHWNEEKKERRRCSICQEWFETDKYYISCSAHSFGETTTSEEPLSHPNKMEWEEKYLNDNLYHAKVDSELSVFWEQMSEYLPKSRARAELGDESIFKAFKISYIKVRSQLFTSQLTELEEEIENMPSRCRKCEKMDTNPYGECECSYEDRGFIKKSDVQTLLSKKKQ